MTAAQFRKIALSLPEALEQEHMNHPDFRVNGKIFATLFTRDEVAWGMAKLKPDQQSRFLREHPEIFEPSAGAWGRQGCTQFRLANVSRSDLPTIRGALFTAWVNAAPKRLLDALPPSEST